ncbi:MAG: pentapeptide repeat-containing protein [Pseudomonadota bacterium]
MLKQFLALATLALALATPAFAQNASHIAKAQKGQSCSGCNLFQADMAYRDVSGADFAKARLRQSNLSLATLDNVNLSNSDLSIANLFGARLNSCDLTGADLGKAAAVGTYFGSSTLKSADLSQANFSGADLSLTIGLTQAQLNKACGDAATRLPQGLRIPRCA